MEKDDVLNELKALHEKLGRRPKKRDSSRMYRLSRIYFGKWNKMMDAAGYEVHYRQTVTLPKEITPDFAYFIGIVITDGHLQNSDRNARKERQYCTLISTSYIQERDMLLALIEKLFQYKSFVREKLQGFSTDLNYEFHINPKNLVEYLHSLGIPYGEKSFIVRVPEDIMQADLIVKTSFLRGVIDGDGSVKEAAGQVAISSWSYGFLEDIQKIYAELKVTCGSIHKDQDGFRLIVSNKAGVKDIYFKCYKNTEFNYVRKRKKLERIVARMDNNLIKRVAAPQAFVS